MKFNLSVSPTLAIAFWLGVAIAPLRSFGQHSEHQPVEPWTMQTAREQLSLYPSAPYLQYVYWQLANREGASQDAESLLREIQGDPRFNDRNRDIDLFSIFSGALAVQESLQLDALTNSPDANPELQSVPIASLSGPTIKSHPWKEMLGDRKPEIGLLPRCVPDDFLFAQFDSLASLGRTLSLSDSISSYATNQLTQDARTQALPVRIQKQLLFALSPTTITQLDPLFEDLAVVSSDLYYSEGNDLSLLFELKEPKAFLSTIDSQRNALENAATNLDRTQGKVLGFPYTRWSNADRTVDAFECLPKPNLYIRSNSLVALERIVAAIQGEDQHGRPAKALGDTDEFKYIRTLMPEGAPEEHAWIYMSDPFIRRMVGPQVKLTQKRRISCYNHLRMIGHASLLHATEHGRLGKSLQELKASKCLPNNFGEKRILCPDGGQYSLVGENSTPHCSHHGSPHYMTPTIESSLSRLTPAEESEYKQFLQQYNQYWRTFFDPIAIRIQLEAKKMRVETVILPLIDNSFYSSLANTLGGVPRPLDHLPVPQRNIFTLAVQLNKENITSMSGLENLGPENQTNKPVDNVSMPTSRWKDLPFIAEALMNTEVSLQLFQSTKPTRSEGLSWRVHILPKIGREDLFNKFHLDEPWDSPHNLALVEQMPSVYNSPIDSLNEQGKTTVLIPRNEEAVFWDRLQKPCEIIDGISNTILVIDADPDHAVIWTKPGDLEVDMEHPRKGWEGSRYGGSAVAFGDSHVELIPTDTPESVVRELLTIAGGESGDRPRIYPDYNQSSFSAIETVFRRQISRLVSDGLGEQLSLNIYDGDPLVDFNVSRFLATMLRFNRSESLELFDAQGLVTLLLLSINSPVYVAAEVKDTQSVDASLAEIDELLATMARRNEIGRNNFFGIQQDYYRFSSNSSAAMRAYSLRFGPVKWRFYWGRIGNGLYLASKPEILEDLMAIEQSEKEGGKHDVTTSPTPEAHAMLRIRPKHWKQVLPDYQRAWAENQRLGCLNNIGILSSLSRTVQLMQPSSLDAHSIRERVRQLEAQLLDSTSYCPAEGEYHFTPGADHVECSIHGTGILPQQPIAPDEATPLGGFLNHLHDLHMELTFLEEGLRAIAVLELD